VSCSFPLDANSLPKQIDLTSTDMTLKFKSIYKKKYSYSIMLHDYGAFIIIMVMITILKSQHEMEVAIVFSSLL